MRIFAVTILAVLATILIGAAILLGVPGDFAERALWITLAVPIIWGVLIIYCYWDAKRWRILGVLTTLCIVSTGVILTNPPTL